MATDLPALGYTTFHENRITVIHRSSLPELHYFAGVKGPLGEKSSLTGRSPIRTIEPNMVIRTLLHGGFFRHITGNNFLTPARTIRELAISNYLALHGIKTPDILAVRIQKKGIFCNIEVISRLVPDSIDLLTYLEKPRGDGKDIIMNAGMLINRIHNLGVYHADLHVKNLLLDSSRSIWVLDLDKAYRLKNLPSFLKRLNIKRFIRSLKKWQTRGRIYLPEAWEGSFMEGYEGGRTC
jgi:3-deoxy-D-manno-octulosonic acid kinase